MTFDLSHLAQFLACPACRSKLVVVGNALVCQSESCRLQFEVKDNIPVMIADEAKQLEPGEWSAAMGNAK